MAAGNLPTAQKGQKGSRVPTGPAAHRARSQSLGRAPAASTRTSLGPSLLGLRGRAACSPAPTKLPPATVCWASWALRHPFTHPSTHHQSKPSKLCSSSKPLPSLGSGTFFQWLRVSSVLSSLLHLPRKPTGDSGIRTLRASPRISSLPPTPSLPRPAQAAPAPAPAAAPATPPPRHPASLPEQRLRPFPACPALGSAPS